MKLDGKYQIDGASPQQVFDAVRDPAALARVLPGCRKLEELAEDSYRVTLDAGLGTLRGRYLATVRLAESEPPERHVLAVEGKGGPGTIHGTIATRLVPHDGGTMVTYEADAAIGGAAAGVGQRMLVTAARKFAEEFFAGLKREIGAGTLAAMSDDGVAAATEAFAARSGIPGPNDTAARPGPTRVFEGRAAESRIDMRSFVSGLAVGFAGALIAVLIGRSVTGSRR